MATGPVLTSAPEPLEITSRAGDWLGLQGELWWLPRTRSPGFEREPKASSPHTSKGKPLCSSPGSSFSAGNSESCLGPRCGIGWDGSPHAPPSPGAVARLPCPAQKLLCAPLTLSWATQGEGRSSLQRDRESCSERILPLHRISKGHPNIVPNSTRGEEGEQRSWRAPALSPVPEQPCSALLCSSPLPPHPQRDFVLGGFCFKHDSLFLPLPSNHEQDLPQPHSFHMCWSILTTPAWAKMGKTNPNS